MSNRASDDWTTATPHTNTCGYCGHSWRSIGVPDQCPNCSKRLEETGGESTDIYEDLYPFEGDPEEDPIAELQLEIHQRRQSPTPEHPFTEMVEAMKEQEKERDEGAMSYRDHSPEESRGAFWREQRRKVLDRDRRRCQGCGTTSAMHRNFYGRGLHIHHIVPESEFDDLEKAHDLSNLIALCVGCHNRYEGADRAELADLCDHDDWRSEKSE